MTKSFLASTALALTLVAAPALAQDKMSPSQDKMSPAASPAPAASGAGITAPASGQWRMSKLIGVDVYNNNDEKIGDISELLTDANGKVDTVIIGVGGFLGLGQTDVAVKFDQLKFVNEPVPQRTATNTSPSGNTPGGAATGGAGNGISQPRPSTVGAATTSNEPRMYPDHAVFNATKEQLKAMPQFKYSQSSASTSSSPTK